VRVVHDGWALCPRVAPHTGCEAQRPCLFQAAGRIPATPATNALWVSWDRALLLYPSITSLPGPGLLFFFLCRRANSRSCSPEACLCGDSSRLPAHNSDDTRLAGAMWIADLRRGDETTHRTAGACLVTGGVRRGPRRRDDIPRVSRRARYCRAVRPQGILEAILAGVAVFMHARGPKKDSGTID